MERELLRYEHFECEREWEVRTHREWSSPHIIRAALLALAKDFVPEDVVGVSAVGHCLFPRRCEPEVLLLCRLEVWIAVEGHLLEFDTVKGDRLECTRHDERAVPVRDDRILVGLEDGDALSEARYLALVFLPNALEFVILPGLKFMELASALSLDGLFLPSVLGLDDLVPRRMVALDGRDPLSNAAKSVGFCFEMANEERDTMRLTWL